MKIQFVLSIATSFLEILFFCGIVFGWPSIEYVLEKEGYFSDLCYNESSVILELNLKNRLSKSGCKEQYASFNLVYTLVLSSRYIASFILGWTFDRFGTWTFGTMMTSIFSLSCFLLTISSTSLSFLLYPAFIFLGLSGFGLMMSNFQLSVLAASFRGIIVTFMSGLLTAAVVVFFLVKIGYDHGIDLNTMFLIITCLSLFLWIRTYVFMPCNHLSLPLDDYVHIGYKEWRCFQKPKLSKHVLPIYTIVIAGNQSAFVKVTEISKRPSKESASFKTCLKSSIFWTNVFHLAVNGFRVNFVFGILQQWMKSFVELDNIGKLTDDFGIVIMFNVLCSPLNVGIVDYVVKKLKVKNKKPKVASLSASLVSMVITSTLGIVLSIMMISLNTYGTFVFLVLAGSFVFGGNATFISMHFPLEHVGKLYGLTYFASAITSLIQYALFQIALIADPSFRYINIGILVAVAFTFVHPLFIYLEIRKVRKVDKAERTAIDQCIDHIEQT